MKKSKELLDKLRIVFPRETCSDYYYATQKEWLETNGCGGYASSTLIGANVRRYHGLLVVPVENMNRRPHVLLSKLEETAHVDGHNFDLSTNQYPFIIFPEGHNNIERFEYDIFPRFVYNLGGVLMQKSILMLHGEPTVLVRYEVMRADHDLSFSVRPLCAFREAGKLTLENPSLNARMSSSHEHGLSIRPYGELPELFFWFSSGSIEEKFYWYKNTEYRKDQERGKEFSEDLFSPVVLHAYLHEGETLDLLVTTEPKRVMNLSASGIESLRELEIGRRTQILTDFPLAHHVALSMAASSESFIIEDEGSIDLSGGFHWDCDKVLDNAIALQGLTLSLGRYDRAKRFLNDRVLPMLKERECRVDVVLWYVNVMYAYGLYGEDAEWVAHDLWPALEGWFGRFLDGRHAMATIRDDGLLSVPPPESPVECMASRSGATVEINALWHNALCVMRHMAHDVGSPKTELYDQLALKARQAFAVTFWNEADQCLYDVVEDGQPDASIRPYQILAVSLPFDLLDRRHQKCVVQAVTRHLLTPFGLRSLSKSDPRYIGVYAGNAENRKSAYHRGSVWPWLMAAYIEAYLKTEDFSQWARDHCWKLIEHFREALHDAGLHTISEIYDADEPHFPKGRIADSRGVAEILRVIELLENSERFM